MLGTVHMLCYFCLTNSSATVISILILCGGNWSWNVPASAFTHMSGRWAEMTGKGEGYCPHYFGSITLLYTHTHVCVWAHAHTQIFICFVHTYTYPCMHVSPKQYSIMFLSQVSIGICPTVTYLHCYIILNWVNIIHAEEHPRTKDTVCWAWIKLLEQPYSGMSLVLLKAPSK